MFSAKKNTIISPPLTNENSPFFQPKLSVNQPNDVYEQEADFVAAKVMHKTASNEAVQPFFTPPPVSILQRTAMMDDNKKEKEKKLQRKESSSKPVEASNSVSSYVINLSSKGSFLSDNTRNFFEPKFGYDFSTVKIHDNTEAAKSAQSVNALAYTIDNNIVFNQNQFSPETDAGKKLLAHELTHVVQQNASKKTSVRQRLANKAKFSTANNISANANKNIGQAAFPSFNKEAIPAPVKQTSIKNNPATTGKMPAETDAKISTDKKTEIKPEETNTPHAPSSPKKDPDFQKAKKTITHESVKQKKHHQPAQTKRTEVENASVLTEGEQKSQNAKEENTTQIKAISEQQEAAKNKFSADDFKIQFKALINQASPKTEEQAKEMSKKPAVGDIATDFSANVAKSQSEVTGPLDKAAISEPEPTCKIVTITAIPLQKAKTPPATQAINPKLVVPKEKTNEEISTQKQIKSVDDAMVNNKLDDDQLLEANEDSFNKAYTAKEFAKQKAAEAPQQYRQQEGAIIADAEKKADTTTTSQLHGLMHKNTKSGDEVLTSQSATETQTEKRQREIKGTIDAIYAVTVIQVKCILQLMTDNVKTTFTNSLKKHTDDFNKNLKNEISEYYGSFRIDDDLFGPDPVVVDEYGNTRGLTDQELSDVFHGRRQIDAINPDVYGIYVKQKNKFTDAMDIELDGIAENVEQGLKAAHNAIETGQGLIASFKATLKGEELAYATSLESEVNFKFTNLEQTIDEAKDDLLNTLADEYRDNLKAMDKSFKDINDELKKGWIERAIEFIETVAKTIYDIVDLVINTVVRLAGIIWRIVKHPVKFFKTLVRGLLDGIDEFISNIGKYLKESFLSWLTGSIPNAGASLTPGTGIEGLFKLALNVLNLGPEDFKKVAEKVLGKEFVQMIDKVMDLINKGIEIGAKILEPVIILFTKGPAALWIYIKEHVQEFIQSAFDRIKETVFFAFIEKGIKWIAGFFVPGGGFVKVVQAILAAFQFVAENIQNIRQFFDSVFDSMEEALNENTSGVKNKIVQGLKMGVVMALDFLADLLGLDKIVASVHKIIQTIRSAILNAVEFVLIKIKPYALAAVKKIKGLYDKGKELLAKAGRKLLGWLGLRKTFKATDGETHKLYFAGSEENPVLMIQSNPVAFSEFIALVDVGTNQNKVAAKQEAIPIAKNIDDEKMKKLEGKTDEEKKDSQAKKEEQVYSLLGQLAKPAGILFGDPNLAGEPDIHFETQSAGHAVKMTSKKLNKKQKLKGSTPTSSNTKSFGILNTRRVAGGASYYVKGHMLNENLGGTGKTWSNLTPLSREGNSNHESEVEATVKAAVNTGAVVEYNVEAMYGYGDNASSIPANDPQAEQKLNIINEEKNVPRGLTCEAWILEKNGDDFERKQNILSQTIINPVEQSAASYILEGTPGRPDIYLNDSSLPVLITIEGFEDGTIPRKIIQAYAVTKKYSTYQKLADATFENQQTEIFNKEEKEKITGLNSLQYKYVKLYKGI